MAAKKVDPNKNGTGKASGLTAISNSNPDLGPEDFKTFYHDMLLIRRFEEKAGQLYGMGMIGGFCHLYIGEEAVVTGFQSAQLPQDSAVTAYRNHGHLLAAGMDPKELMAELTGRVGGCSRGKGGSMHMFLKEKNFYGGHGIVGAQVSIGTGLAFAHKYNNDGGVALVYMGDGAANQGQVAECYNMAALWKLPALYIIENNQYSMGTSVKRHAAGEFYKRGEGFGIPGEKVDGMDVLAVREAALRNLAAIRNGGGPRIIEVVTYRYRGHSMSDPQKYRSKEEVEEYKTGHDPIEQIRNLMTGVHKISEDDVKAIETKVKTAVADAAQFAQDSPLPDDAELWTDVLIATE